MAFMQYGLICLPRKTIIKLGGRVETFESLLEEWLKVSFFSATTVIFIRGKRKVEERPFIFMRGQVEVKMEYTLLATKKN